MAYLQCLFKAVFQQRGIASWIALVIAYLLGIGLLGNDYPIVKDTINQWWGKAVMPPQPSIWWWAIPFVVWLLIVLVHQETMRLLRVARLQFSAPYVSTFPFFHRSRAITPMGQIPIKVNGQDLIDLVSIDVRNCPHDMTSGLCVTKAFCSIAFYDFHSGRIVRKFDYPRWEQNPKSSQINSPPDHYPNEWNYRDLQPNGDHNRIDFGIKYFNESDMYGFCGASQINDGWKDEKLKIPQGKYHVSIDVSGSGVRQPAETWIMLENPGAGKNLIVSPTRRPPKGVVWVEPR
jgi:hypothetical protein